eukprot:XP_001698858.1 predicted protein [Chlamydomonas reinhardtii]
MSAYDLAEADYLTRLTVRRLAELNATRARVEALEARASLAEEYENERRKLDLLQRLQDKYSALSPIVVTDASLAIADLREHLQGVYDADLLSDPQLRALTMLHAVAFSTRTLDRFSEPGRYALEGSAGVLELGASTLAMFSSRAGGAVAFAEAFAVPVLVKLLSPLYAPVVVVNIANAIGNLADPNMDGRHLLRRGNTKNQAETIAAIRANSNVVRNVRRVDPELLRFEEGTPRVKSSYAPPPMSPAALGYGYGTPTKALARPTTADSYRRSAALDSMTGALARSVSPGRYRSLRASTLAARYSPPPASALALAEPESALGVMPEVDSDLLKRKHLIRYTAEELATLLQEMGFDKLDLRSFKLNGVAGVDLLDMSEDEMVVRLLLPRHKVRKLRALQRAVALFDRIATLPRQGRLSEVELRLFLAAQGCGSVEVDKVVRLVRSLVRTDKLDFVTFWDFVCAYDWIAQAFRIYAIPA